MRKAVVCSIRPYQEKMIGANAASLGELNAQMQANPRIARLLDLGGAKRCG